MNMLLNIPTCNIIACESIIENGGKTYICRPFTAISKKSIREFYTYTVIQGIPNGWLTFKIQITNQDGRIVRETEKSRVQVSENLIIARTKWSNIGFYDMGEYTLKVLILCNNEFEVVGSSNIYTVQRQGHASI